MASASVRRIARFFASRVVNSVPSELRSGFAGASIAAEIMWRPLYPWDAWGQWATKARVWFELGRIVPFVRADVWLSAATAAYFDASPDNPSTVPLLQVWICVASPPDITLVGRAGNSPLSFTYRFSVEDRILVDIVELTFSNLDGDAIPRVVYECQRACEGWRIGHLVITAPVRCRGRKCN